MFVFFLFGNSPESKPYQSILMSSWFVRLITPQCHISSGFEQIVLFVKKQAKKEDRYLLLSENESLLHNESMHYPALLSPLFSY